MLDVVVVGAGVIGASVAMRLALAGANVTVLDARRPGSGASMTSFAWLNSANKRPRAYFDLNVAGMQAHLGLRSELGSAPWLHEGGRLEWIPDHLAAAAERAFERLRSWGYAGGWIEPKEALALEPDVSPASLQDCRPAHFPQEAWIDPALYVGAMLRIALSHGARVQSAMPVAGLTLKGDRVQGVRTSAGEIAADVVVNCAGAGVNSLSDAVPPTPMASTTGFLAFTPPLPLTVERIVAAPGISFRPDGGGRLMVHSGAADTALSSARDDDDLAWLASGLAARIAELLPAAGAFDMEACRVTQRPIPEDGYPVVGPGAGVEGYYVAVSHSAVTLAAWLGRAICDEILFGPRRTELDAYRPERFLSPLGQDLAASSL